MYIMSVQNKCDVTRLIVFGLFLKKKKQNKKQGKIKLVLLQSVNREAIKEKQDIRVVFNV